MKTKYIGVLLKEKVLEFSKEIDGLNCEFEENKNAFFYKIYTKLISIEFVYTKKEKLMVPASLLFCRIYLRKNSEIYYHMPELMGVLNPQDFRTWYFPYIENEVRLHNCFTTLTGMLKKYLPKLTKQLQTPGMLEELESSIEKERLAIFEQGKEESKMKQDDRLDYLLMAQGFVEEFALVPRFSSFVGYECFKNGNYAKAYKQYSKLISKNHVTEYENRLLEFIKSLMESGDYYEAIPLNCNAAIIANQYKGSKRDFIDMITNWFVMGLLFSAFYIVIILIANAIMGAGAEFVGGMKWYDGFWLGGLPGIFAGLAYRRELSKALKRKNAEEMIAFDDLLNGDKINKFVRILANFLIVGITIFLFVLLQASTIFYTSHMMYDDGMPMVAQNIKYEYQDIEKIYHVDGRYNAFDEWVGRGSYILEFKDGTIIDLDAVTNVKDTEKYILPLLDEYVTEIEHVTEEERIKELIPWEE